MPLASLLLRVLLLLVFAPERGIRTKNLHSELSDLLAGDLVEEFVEVLVSQVVVDFSFLRIDNVALFRRRNVTQSVLILALILVVLNSLSSGLVSVSSSLHL
jgi:hypothetical protein